MVWHSVLRSGDIESGPHPSNHYSCSLSSLGTLAMNSNVNSGCHPAEHLEDACSHGSLPNIMTGAEILTVS